MPKENKVAPIAQLKAEKELVKEVKELTKQVQSLKNSELIKIYKNPKKFFLLSFIHGLLVGLGTVLGATLLIGLLVYLLSQIQLVPFIGDFVTEILQEIKQ